MLQEIRILQIEQFCFENTKKAFSNGIIKTRCLAGHALRNALQDTLVRLDLVEPTLMGMQNQVICPILWFLKAFQKP